MSASPITDSQVRLRDGRTLGYAEFGDPGGQPIFVFNGSASRRFHPVGAADAGLGARTITVDRPGIGKSDPKPGRSLADWADDVRELADQLGIGRFGVAGASAGGPYAAACAFRLPERVGGLALVSSLAPFDVPEVSRGMNVAYKMIPWMTRRVPRLLTFAQSLAAKHPPSIWRQFYKRLPECDRATLRAHPELDFSAMLIGDVAEIYRQGPASTVADMAVLTGPWGFDPAAIRVPTQIWQGERDVNVPPAMARYLAGAIPGSQLHMFPDEGHLMYLNHWPEIVGVLLKGAQSQ
ncbi:MAG TPA: alpha/beta hydrolase [Herpetosiphonaceae bacterium]|nr:alpha/beta hydrolase [Herpetosiphonaceae bacterium]